MNNKMAINAYLSIIESKNKISQQAEQKQNHGYREHFGDCPWEAGWGNRQKR